MGDDATFRKKPMRNVASTKTWVKWVATIAAVCLFGTMLYVQVVRKDSQTG